MAEILLTSEEYHKVEHTTLGSGTIKRRRNKDGDPVYPYYPDAEILEQLRKVYYWGNLPCPHGEANKRKCDLCWRVLLKESRRYRLPLDYPNPSFYPKYPYGSSCTNWSAKRSVKNVIMGYGKAVERWRWKR